MRLPTPSNLHSGLAAFGLVAWLMLPGAALAQTVQDQLPDMGTAAASTLSLEDEYRIGRMVMRGLRDSGARDRGPGNRRIPAVARPAAVEPRPGRQPRLLVLHRARPGDQRVCAARRVHRHPLRVVDGDQPRERAGRRARPRGRARHAAPHRPRTREPVARQHGLDGGHARRDPDRRDGGRRIGRHHGRRLGRPGPRGTGADQLHARERVRGRPRRHGHPRDRGLRPELDGELLRDHGPAHPARTGRRARAAAHAPGHQRAHRRGARTCRAVPGQRRRGGRALVLADQGTGSRPHHAIRRRPAAVLRLALVERAGRHVGAVLWQGAGPTGRGRYGSSRRRVHAPARRPSRGAAIPHCARPGPAGRRPQQRRRSSRWSGRTSWRRATCR